MSARLIKNTRTTDNQDHYHENDFKITDKNVMSALFQLTTVTGQVPAQQRDEWEYFLGGYVEYLNNTGGVKVYDDGVGVGLRIAF